MPFDPKKAKQNVNEYFKPNDFDLNKYAQDKLFGNQQPRFQNTKNLVAPMPTKYEEAMKSLVNEPPQRNPASIMPNVNKPIVDDMSPAYQEALRKQSLAQPIEIQEVDPDELEELKSKF